jgi:hypothetical protein
VSITSAPARAAPGDGITVVAQSTPAAGCSIDAGPLSLGAVAALALKTADSAGRVSWTWTLGQVSNGVYRVSVSCGGAPASVTIEVFR